MAQQWPERSWEMRWYRQHTLELIRHERANFVALVDEKVVDAAHRRDACVRHRRLKLARCPELVVLRRDDERAFRDRRQGPRREAQVLRADADEGNGVGAAAAFEVREDLERAEAVADEPERQTWRHGARVVDSRAEVVGLVAPTTPLAGARADAAEVEAERVPPALSAGARDRGHDRRPHRAPVRRQSVSDDHDRRWLYVGYPQRRLEPFVDPPRLFAHDPSLREPPRGTRCI